MPGKAPLPASPLRRSQPGEEAPLGLIMCAGKFAERVELLEWEKNGLCVAEYLTELPPRAALQKRFHKAVAQAPARLEQRELMSHGQSVLRLPMWTRIDYEFSASNCRNRRTVRIRIPEGTR